jgi:hypothetical protein
VEKKAAIQEKIQRGLAQLNRGEGIPGDQLRDRLDAEQAVWLAKDVSPPQSRD